MLFCSNHHIFVFEFLVDYQINSVVSWFDETLTLSSPLPLGKRSGAQWLKVLNKAMSLSLSSYLNEAYSSLPDLLKGARFGDEGAGRLIIVPSLLPNLGRNINSKGLDSTKYYINTILNFWLFF